MAKQFNISFTLTIAWKWIDDGFTLTPENLAEIIREGILDYASEEEKKISDITIEATDIKPVYMYSELSERAKKKAIEKLWDINVDYDWWDYVVNEYLPNFMKESSLSGTYGGEFDLERGSFIRIDGIHTSVRELQEKATATQTGYPDAYAKIIKPFFDQFTEKELRQLCRLESAQIVCGLRGSTGRRNAFREIESYGTSCKHARITKLIDKLENAWEDLVNSTEHYWLHLLRREYEYLTSKEAIEECIEANDYHFYEDGTIA